MCGIAGIFDDSGGPVDRARIDAMLAVIAHRGPDDEGAFVEGGVGIGNRRLSIIDLPGGSQPMTNEDGSVVVVFNGEIYNYRELAARLRGRGHSLRTASDTETIVHLYEDLGDELVHQLRGMFAFALYDRRRQRLLIARDRLGIKPLYYSHDGRRLCFGSEVKSVIQGLDHTPGLSPDALAQFLVLKYVPAPGTMFRDIRALPPGHVLTYDRNGLAVRRYWDLRFDNRTSGPVDEEEAATQLRELLEDAVRSHLVSDVPFGAFLSGGIDSSTIVALMSHVLSSPVKTFSVGYDGDAASISELPFARLVAQRYATDHHEIVVRASDFTESIDRVVWHLDQPIADEAAIPNYMVSALAARHVKMVLTGEGGDELFGGYARHSGERLSPVFSALPRPVRAAAIHASRRLPGLRRPKQALYALCQDDEASRFVSWFALFNAERAAAVLSPELRAGIELSTATDAFAAQLARTDATDPLSRMLYLDTKLWLSDDLLARGDKTSMAASIEARLPLLDHPLVEFAASLPPTMKVRGLTRKYLLRKVAGDLLPASVLKRKKQGFPTPVSLWFRTEARELLRDHLSPTTLANRGLFDPAYVQVLLDEHERGFADHGSLLFGLLVVEVWHRLFIDCDPRVSAPAFGAA
jgi:asparagine synthase (glutamine-hydrolysing)